MYARSSTFRARRESLDAGVAFVRDEVMPVVLAMPGCIGLSLMVERNSGRCIATTSWDTMDRMRASEGRVGPMRERGGTILGADPFVEEWEITNLHRAHRTGDAACVRCTWLRMDPEMIDHAGEVYRMAALPAIEELQGFCSASVFVNREIGRVVTNVAFDDRSAMSASREMARSIRTRGAQEAQADVLDVAEFDLVVAHLRVPEMA